VVLAYNVLVIVWGAYVRASGSGAGCGSHWPTCNGAVIPRAPTVQTVVEFGHRVTSGLALVSILALLVLTLRATGGFRPAAAPDRAPHPARRTAVYALVFVLLEAAIGAGLVLFEWVAGNTSHARGFASGAHLINTFLLLGALALTAYHLEDPGSSSAPGGLAATLRRHAGLVTAATVGVFLTGASGGIAALGDTLFPATSLAHGFAQDASTTAHIFLKLRVLHPIFAVTTAAILLVSARALRGPHAITLAVLVCAQATVGFFNLFLLAPVPLQLVHLALADATWVAFVLVVASSAASAPSASSPLPRASEAR
jgi:cytochrome c oxidase assembly protein subunit 15